jgi:hypothetical protein
VHKIVSIILFYNIVACKMGGYTRAISGQRLGKHIPTTTDVNATIEELCFLCGPCRDVISKGQC